MNIVQIHSGLGNQMFQYAFYAALKQHMPDTKIDASVYRHRPSHNGYELERIFAIRPDHALSAERRQMADIDKDLFSVLRRALGWRRHTTGIVLTEPDPAEGWRPQLLHAENSYLTGYWQTEKYFTDIADRIRSDFQFRLPLPKADKELAQEIQSANSVSVHIRRGDYLKERRKADYNVCTETYYRCSIKYMQDHVKQPVFYVFSDEPEWGEMQDFFPQDTVFVSGHCCKDAYIDMQLMSLCKHHIIANSSFSWWGAWLGEKENTIVAAPRIWFRYRPRPDILPARWIAIDVD